MESVSKAIDMTDMKLLGIPVIVELTESEKNRRVDMMMQNTPDVVLQAPPKPVQPKFNRIQVMNLHSSVTDESLRKLFEPFGMLEFCTVQRDPASNRSTGVAFVQ